MARTNPNPRAIEYGHDVAHHENEGEKKNFTFLIVIVSLLFVAVFGGALVGGVVSGDPSNAFFFTIIGASAFAIGIAALVSIRYYAHGKRNNDEDYDIETMEKDDIARATFSRSEDEDEVEADDEEYYDEEAYRRRYSDKTPVDARIKEVRAKNVPADYVSALSEADYTSRNDYTEETRDHRAKYRRNERKEKKGSFDFTSVASSSRLSVYREDPPEESGPAVYENQDQRSKDPSAPKIAASGDYEESDIGLNTPTQTSNIPTNPVKSPANRSIASMSVTSRYDTPYDDDESTLKNSTVNGDTSDKAESEIGTEVLEELEAGSEIEAMFVEKNKQQKRHGRDDAVTKTRSRSRSRSKSPGKEKKKVRCTKFLSLLLALFHASSCLS